MREALFYEERATAVHDLRKRLVIAVAARAQRGNGALGGESLRVLDGQVLGTPRSD